MAGSARSRARSSAEMRRARASLTIAFAAAASASLAVPMRRSAAAVRDRRRRDPGLAHRRQGRSGARPRDRRQPAGRPVPALPLRARSRRSGSRADLAPDLKGAGARWSRGAAAAAHRRFEPSSIRTRSCRRITGSTGCTRVAPALRGKPILTRRADRGCGGLPGDVAGLIGDRIGRTRDATESRRGATGGAVPLAAGCGAAVDHGRARRGRRPPRCRRRSARWSARPRSTPGKVKLDMPPLVENGNTVPLTVAVESPMTATDHVKAIHVFTEKNPQPNVISVHLGPRAGRASVATRIRLADTQTVVAIAETERRLVLVGHASTSSSPSAPAWRR